MSRSLSKQRYPNENDELDDGDTKQINLNESIDSIGSKRGRPLIPDAWT